MNTADRRQPCILDRCVSIDLEVDPGKTKIFAFAAVLRDPAKRSLVVTDNVDTGLSILDDYCRGFDHVIGHNILHHDLPYLIAASPRFAKLAEAPIDTLRLNPLAFPRNPYHHLVKHYQDGRLQTGHVNNPELDARLVFEVLENQITAFRRLNKQSSDALNAYHYLCCRAPSSRGFDQLFSEIRAADIPRRSEAEDAMRRVLNGDVCAAMLEHTLECLDDTSLSWPMAYALSWISVAGGDSVMSPWVRMQFREASRIVRTLRDTNCGDPKCVYCRTNNDPKQALNRWFGFENFRPEPVDEMGRPLQERIVESAMNGESLLGILPTGTGKSICYQIPALVRFNKTGALTVVISPLVALMADQVQGLARAEISSAVTINGLLSLPERQDALDKVRMGDAAILLISPEQLRSMSVRSVLAQRDVGLWVMDEAHCVSKWGHDFRPDYRYVGRFIKERSDEEVAPVLCLTATAKPDVVQDIRGHFKQRLGLELTLLDGGASRSNLCFEVLSTQRSTKMADILDRLEKYLPETVHRGPLSTVQHAVRQKGLPRSSSNRDWTPSVIMPVFLPRKNAKSRKPFELVIFVLSRQPTRSAWVSTNPIFVLLFTATFQARSKTICKKQVGPDAIKARPNALFSSVSTMLIVNSASVPVHAWHVTKLRQS